MPDLGKAVYTLVLNTSEYTANFDRAEVTAKNATNTIALQSERASEAVASLGASAGVMATKVEAGMGAAATASEEGGAAVAAGADRAGAAATRAGVATETGLARAGKSWMKFGTIGGRALHLVGLGILYETVKSGISTLNANQQSLAQINSVLETTGHVAGVTSGHLMDLAHHWEMVAGSQRAATQQMMAVLAGFTNIRNEGAGSAAIFDRTVQAIENISTRTGKSLQTVSVAVGKAIQDPGKYLMALARTGVTFTKTQLDMVKSLVAANKPLQAQQYVLQALETRYGAAKGAAYQFGKTAQGQFDIAKNKLSESAANIIQTFIPAFVQLTHVIIRVANLLSHHAQVVKDVAYAYILLKLAAIATRTVVDALPLLRWIVGMQRVGTATKTTTVETKALTGALEVETGAADASAASSAGLLTRLGALSLGFGPVIAAAILAGGALIYFRNQANAAQQAAANAVAAVPGGGTELHASEMMFYARRASDYRKSGMGAHAASEKARADTVQQFNDPAFNTKANGEAGGGPGSALPLDNSTFTTTAAKKKKKKKKGYGLSGLNGLLPLGLQLEEQVATRKGQSAVDAVLRKEQTYLETLLHNRKLSLSKRLEIETELTNVWQQLQADVKKSSKKAGLIPDAMQISLQKAIQTGNLKAQAKILKQEESYLKGLLDNQKLSLDKRLKVEKELTAVLTKLKAVNKKIANGITTSRQKFDQEMQAFVDTRGTFFNQFASSVFHNGPGGLAMGSMEMSGDVNHTRNTTINQQNHYQEIPKDRYRMGRDMSAAAAGALG